MWKKRLCLGTSSTFGMSTVEQINTFAKIGFDGFFTGWQEDSPLGEWARVAKDAGLIYQSVHAPFGRAAQMWGTDESEGRAALGELLACLEDCQRWEVPIMVVHAFIGFEEHTPTP